MKYRRTPSAGYLPSGSVVAERIAEIYPSLSDALRAFADFVLNQPMKVAQMSINETVDASGVSVATANRFARKLGFDGYSQFRSELIRGFEPLLAPVERIKRTISAESPIHSVVAATIEEDLGNLQETLRNLDPARVTQAVELLSKAERIFVVAFDNAAALASIFAHRLALAGKDIRTIENGGGRISAARHLSRFGRNDLVVAIAFPLYMRDTVELTEAVKKSGVPILAITDSQTSPLASLATLTLYVHARRTAGSVSDAAILGVLEALAAGVSARFPKAAEKARQFTEFAYPWLIASNARRS
jgi:DNA-binding MurR/RpiR family transcriptional regulator